MMYHILRSEENSLRYNGFAEDRPLPVVSILKSYEYWLRYFSFNKSVQPLDSKFFFSQMPLIMKWLL